MLKISWLPGLFMLLLATGCTFTQKVRTGQQAYEVKQYSVAAALFETEYEASQNKSEKARLAFLAGESYRFLNDHGSAGNWYLTAYKEGYGETALEAYANSLKHQERYHEAIQAYEELLRLNPGSAAYRSGLTITRQAFEWSQDPVPGFRIEKALFNSPASDYSPQVIGPGQILFTSDRSSRENSETYLWTGRAFSDLFVTNPYSNQVVAFNGPVNTQHNEGTAVMNPDGNSIVFTRCFVDEAYDAWCKLMISHRKGNSWSDPETLPFVKDKINYGQPAFSSNGVTLFFASDDPEGQGGHDLYFTQPDEKGGWSDPVNLGPMLNTSGEEVYPTVYRDTLYYSSDHLPGLGGLDIFKTFLGPDLQWTPPINLRAPINSGGDDFGFVVDTFTPLRENVKMQGFFTSSREGASRNDDIYSFVFTTIEAPVEVAQESQEPKVPEVHYQVFLALKVMEPEYEIKGDPNSRVIGKRPLPNGPVILSGTQMDERFVTDELGQLLLKLDLDKSYVVTARYRDHLAASVTVQTTNMGRNPENPIMTINETLMLDPIFKDKEIVLENIFYDYDEWFIRDDAKPSLDELSTIMKTNPSIRIQLASHTDCRGTDEYNLELSQKRAQAAVDYLMSVGIPSRRLQAQGFGESNPAVVCECEQCTEEQHQKNRRTTFKIID